MKLFNEFCLRDIAHGAATSPLNDLDPSEAQLKAGNYKKGQIRLHGMPISIENPQGSIRRGVDPTGVKWACTMHAHYGYFKGTIGADGGHVDCFLGPDCENPKCPVFVVNQIRVHGEEFGIFDEHKVMVGYCDRNAAIAGYMINFSPGWKGLGSIEETTIHGLRNWLSHGDTQAPFEHNTTTKESKMENLVEFLDFTPGKKMVRESNAPKTIESGDKHKIEKSGSIYELKITKVYLVIEGMKPTALIEYEYKVDGKYGSSGIQEINKFLKAWFN